MLPVVTTFLCTRWTGSGLWPWACFGFLKGAVPQKKWHKSIKWHRFSWKQRNTNGTKETPFTVVIFYCKDCCYMWTNTCTHWFHEVFKKTTYKSKSNHLDNCCYYEAVKCAIILYFRCKIVFIHFVLFLVFTLSDQTLSRYSDDESNGLHFLFFWKISDGCFYIRISSITDVKLKFVFTKMVMTISSAKYIRAFLR